MRAVLDAGLHAPSQYLGSTPILTAAMFNKPLAPQCPILASRRPQHLRRSFAKPSAASIVIPSEVETPRPCLSTVCVTNASLEWSYRTGIVSWSAGPDDRKQLHPGQPVVLWYNPNGQYMRYADGSEQLMPELVEPTQYKRNNPEYRYCGLLYSEQVLPKKLKTKTLLVVVAGHQTVMRRQPTVKCWDVHTNSGDPAFWSTATTELGQLGIWLTHNSVFLFTPGRVNRANNS